MLVPLDRLSADEATRHGALRDYFCDKDATARKTAQGWELSLAWSDAHERYVDPKLDQGLSWWGDGVSRGTMGLALREAEGVATALHDTWTLYYWSRWLAGRPRDATEPVTVLHVDDHRDVAAPRLFIAEDGFEDPITGERVRLTEPKIVRSAIESGAIGMGSFLTPFLHTLPGTEVRHLCQPPKATCTIDYRISRRTEPDTLMRPGALRPAIALTPDTDVPAASRYRHTPDLTAWLDGLRDGPLLLHIDMDYFNNRYDGDSDWKNRVPQFDPPLSHVLEMIDHMIDALGANVGRRLASITVAYSPGFFPAELWQAADRRLRSGLVKLRGKF